MAAFGTQDYVIGKIGKHRELLYSSVELGLERYRSLEAQDRLDMHTRCRADFINSMVIAEARKQFQGVGGSRFWETNNTTYHMLNGCVVWYKQLDREGLPSNYPTQSANEMLQGSFGFAPQQLLMVLGFQFDELVQNVQSVSLIRFGSNKTALFSIELEKQPVVRRATIIPIGNSPSPIKKQRVVLRRGPEQQQLQASE